MSDLMLLGSLLAGFTTANAYRAMPIDVAGTGSPNGGQTADLLARCAQGDAKAFRALYDASSARLYAVALRITRNPPLAADALHDAMLQVWRNASRYDVERGNADGWLVSLVRYRALDIARRQGREITGVEMPERVDESPDALTLLATDADGAALRVCLEQVDPPRRKLILLAFIDGLTQSEVAVRVGQPLGTVKSSIRRALMGLRACLEGQPRRGSEARP